MDDLVRLIYVLNGTLAVLPGTMESCTFIDDEKLAKRQSDTVNGVLTQTCSSILAASRIILSRHEAKETQKKELLSR